VVNIVTDIERKLTIVELTQIKGRLPESKRELPIVMNLYKESMTIDDIIKEIKNNTRFGINFVTSNMIRLKQYPQMQKYIPKEPKQKEDKEPEQQDEKGQ